VFFSKLAVLTVLTCVFYVGLTVVLEAVLWVVGHSRGLSLFVSAKHPGLSLGVAVGLVFAVVWLISFSAAWWIVSIGLRSRLPIPTN
jgi:hypothetical protein